VTAGLFYADVWSQSKYFAEYSDTKGCSTDTYIAGSPFHIPTARVSSMFQNSPVRVQQALVAVAWRGA